MADQTLPSQDMMLERLQKIMEKETSDLERKNAQDDSARAKPEAEDKLFGMFELSPQMNSLVRLGVDWADPYVRQYGEDFLRTSGSAALAKVMKSNPEKAEATAQALANAIGWGYVMKRPFIGGFNGAKRLHSDRGDLADRLQPILRAEGIMYGGHGALSKAGLDDNEIMQVEHQRIGSNFKYNIYRDVGAELIVTAPQIALKVKSNNEWANSTADTSKPKAGEDSKQFTSRRSAEIKELREQLVADGHDPDTVQTIIKENMNGGFNQAPGSGKKEISQDMLQSLGPAFGAIGTATVRQNITSHQKKHTDHLEETALDKIEKIYEKALETRRISKIDGKDLKTYVKDIFQTHQKNMGQKHVGERLNERFDYASEQIAEAIERGRMHPMALVHLVGERTIVKRAGKSIASRAEIDEALDAMCEKMPAKFDVDVDEYLGESTMTGEDIKHILTSLNGQARDLFVEIIPDEVLLHVGLSEEDIHSTHQRNKKEFGKLLTTALMDVASMSKDELEAANLHDAEIKLVYDLAGKGKTGDIKSVLAGVSTHGEFKKGVEWPLASMKDYWMQVAADERQIGDEYKKNNEELTPEREAREADEVKAAKEAEKAKEKDDEASEKSHVEKHTSDDKEDVMPTLAHESKLKSDKMNPFDEAEAANDASFDVPDTLVASAKDSHFLGDFRMTLKGKAAIVTGSTSGIGLGVAEALAREGANVMLNGFGNFNEIEAERKRLADTYNVDVDYNGADMSEPSEIRAMVRDAELRWGAIDILVNNAGIQHVEPIDTFDDGKWDAIIAINMSSNFHSIKAASKKMKAKGWGRIINIASVHGLVASEYKAAYVTAKHGVVGMTKVAALDLAPHGITANAICPGYVNTPLVQAQIPDQAKTHGITEEEVIEQVLLKKTAIKQFVEIEDIAAQVLYLCSDAARCVTGSAISIDGGWVAQ